MPNRPLYSVVVSLHLERVMYTGRIALVYFSGEQRVPAGTKNVNAAPLHYAHDLWLAVAEQQHSMHVTLSTQH